MLQNFRSLSEVLRNLNNPEEFSSKRGWILEELSLMIADYEKLKFKYERSNKEKNILSSLLTRTSSDLKKVSENLKIRAEELSTILSTIPAYVYFKDLKLRYILVNQLFAELTGLPARQIEGKTVHDVLPKFGDNTYFDMEARVLKNGVAAYDIEEQFELDGRVWWVSTNVAPIRNTNGQIIGLIGISWDITDRKLYESELRSSKELAEAGTIAKNEFIASISHEFRTPMNGILGLAEMLKNSGLDKDQEDLLKGIVSSAENLLVLVNDLLDFSAIEAGKMELEFNPFMLDRVLEEICQLLRIRAVEKGLDISMVIGESVPLCLVGDSKRVGQIIINLAGNAIKFTEQGSVRIEVHLIRKTDSVATLRFEVIDTGVGIPPDSIDSLFKVFSRVKQKQHRLVSGTGLGLSICKKLTDLLGGEIGVESEPGRGSKFWFTLTFNLHRPKPKTLQGIPFESEQTYKGKRVLVAEDNLINQKIVSYQLERLGFEVVMAINGEEALEKYEDGVFDLILLDIQMPVLDGFQVAAAIRKQELYSDRHIPIVALTANAMKGDREKYIAAGMDYFVGKPFTALELRSAIDQATNAR